MIESSSSSSAKSFLLVLGVVVAILCVAVFGQVVAHRYITLDDIQLIFFNPAAKGPTWEHLTLAFTTFDPELYIPFTLVSYQLEFLFFGTNAAVTHAVNLLLHIGNATLVGWLILLLCRKRWVAFVTAILFAIHPLQTEAVAWASARKDVLSSLFFLSSSVAFLLWYERRESKVFPALSFVLFFCGLLSKALVLPLPVLLPIFLWMRGEKINRRILVTLLPFFALSVIFGIVGLFGKQEIVSGLTPLSTVLMAAKSTAFYLQSFLWPSSLAVMYPQTNPISLVSLEFGIPVIIVATVIILPVLLLGRTRIPAGAMLFFFLILLPTFINFSNAGDIYFASDRYVYLPSIAFFFLVAYGLNALSESSRSDRWRGHIRSVVHALGGTILLLLCFVTYAQATTWKDSISVFEHNVTLYPKTAAAHLNLGVLYLESGDPERAIMHFKESAQIRLRSHALTGLAAAYHAQGKNDDAIREYQRSMALDPEDAEPHFGLANLYAEKEDSTLAEAEYERAILLDPNYVAAYNNYGVLLMNEGKLELAEKHFLSARKLNPAFGKTLFNLGKLYQAQRRNEEAISAFEALLLLEPKSVEGMINLAASYIITKNPGPALELLKRVNILEPDNPDAAALVKEMIRLGMVG